MRERRNDAEKAQSMQHAVKSEPKPNDRNRQNQLDVKPKAQSTESGNRHEDAEGLRGALASTLNAKKAGAPVTGKAGIVTQKDKVATSKLPVSAPEPRTPLQMRNDAEKAQSMQHKVKSEQKPNDRNTQNQLDVKPKAQSTESVNRHAAAEGRRVALRQEKVSRLNEKKAKWTTVVGKITIQNSNAGQPSIHPVLLRGR
jgi:hypothetical protein